MHSFNSHLCLMGILAKCCSAFFLSARKKRGIAPFLSSEAEIQLATHIKLCQKYGQPLTFSQLRHNAWTVEQMRGEQAFGNDGPSKGFVYSFLKRHPDIIPRRAEEISRSALAINKKDVREWHETIRLQLEDQGFADILNDPARIWNTDESGFRRHVPKRKVLADSEADTVYQEIKSKEQFTALFTFSAAGDIARPFIVFKGKRLTPALRDCIPPDVDFTFTENGWQTMTSFIDWLGKFHADLVKRGVQFPIILYVDGHTSHSNIEVSKYCNFYSFGKLRTFLSPLGPPEGKTVGHCDH